MVLICLPIVIWIWPEKSWFSGIWVCYAWYHVVMVFVVFVFVRTHIYIYIYICTIQLTWYSLTGSSILGIIWVYSWILLVYKTARLSRRVGIVEIWGKYHQTTILQTLFYFSRSYCISISLFKMFFQLSEFTDVRKRPWSKTVSKLQRCFSLAFRVNFILKPPKPPNGTWPQICLYQKRTNKKHDRIAR